MTDNTLYWIWYASLFGYGTRRGCQLLGSVESPKEFFCASREELASLGVLTNREIELFLRRDLTQAREIQDRARQLGCTLITPDSPHYPQKLSHIYAKPLVLYCIGDLSGLDERLTIGMVGSRQSSPYGVEAASALSCELAAAGAVIVSGMAVGIDQACHAGALKASGRTIAVLGCGIDLPYPKDSGELKRQIVRRGGAVITEFPPGTPPKAPYFPVRNRVLSGLCDGVVVVEADIRSGSLITAGYALTQGRDVFAVPGRIFDRGSRGCNKLIAQGAIPVLSGADVLDQYLYSCNYPLSVAWEDKEGPESEIPPHQPQNSQPVKKTAPDYLTDCQLAVYQCMGSDMITADSIAMELSLPITQVLGALTELEIYGLVKAHPGRRFSI